MASLTAPPDPFVVLHVRVTEHPTSGLIIQPLREAFAYDAVPRYLIFDNDKKYGADVLSVIAHMDIRRKQITPYSPWQNRAAERSVATLGKSTPSMRTATSKPSSDAEIVGHPRLGGVHHRYEWRQPA